MLKDDDFSNSAKVDRYGRKLSSSGTKKALERLYVPDKEELEVDDDDVVEKELKRAGAEDAEKCSTTDDEDNESEDEDGGGDEEEEESFPNMKAEQAAVEMGEVSTRFAVVNLDWDHLGKGPMKKEYGSKF